MSTPISSAPQCDNLLLGTLTEEEYQALVPRIQTVRLQHKEVVAERNKAPTHIYFPCTAVLSVLAYMSNGAAVEVGTIGNEGFFGIEILAGGEISTETTVCQVEGNSLRMTVRDFKEAIAGDTALRRICQRYMLVYISLVSQAVACNRLHSVEERFARWMLMTHDRVEGDTFYLTQEFISDMLGVHRPSVSLVASAFQQAGIIRYSRGHMTILKRQTLEEMCCECYGIVSDQFNRMLTLNSREAG